MSFREKSGSQEQIEESIRILVAKFKTDKQIAGILRLPVSTIYNIRKNVLKLVLYGRKKKCSKCGQLKTTCCFNFDAEHIDWCILCRRKYGDNKLKKDVRLGRPIGSKTKIITNEETIFLLCLRCDECFETPVIRDVNGNKEYFRLCNRCRKIVSGMEQVSI